MRPIQTKPPFTPNPLTWRSWDNVSLGDHLLGEDIIDLADHGFCGETVAVSCPTCGEVLGNIPVELVGEQFRDITTYHVTPVLNWHDAKHHPRCA